MLNLFSNTGFKIKAFESFAVAGNKVSGAYSPNLIRINAPAITGLGFGNLNAAGGSMSANVGFMVNVVVMSTLADALLVTGSNEIVDTSGDNAEVARILTKAYCTALSLNGGQTLMGDFKAATEEVKVAKELKDAPEISIKVGSTEASSTTASVHTHYSSAVAANEWVGKATANLSNAFDKLEQTVSSSNSKASEIMSAVSDLETPEYKAMASALNHVSGNYKKFTFTRTPPVSADISAPGLPDKVPEKMSAVFEDYKGNYGALIKETISNFKGVYSALSNKDVVVNCENYVANQHVSATSAVQSHVANINLSSVTGANEFTNKFAKMATAFGQSLPAYDAGGSGGNASTSTTVQTEAWKIIRTGEKELKKGDFITKNPADFLTFHLKNKTTGKFEEKSITKFFNSVNSIEEKLQLSAQSVEQQKLYLIGLLFPNASENTTSRTLSVGFVPEAVIGIAYNTFSVKGLAFDHTSLRITSPLFSIVSQSVRDYTTFGIYGPQIIGVNIPSDVAGQHDAVGTMASAVFGNKDKTIAERLAASNDSVKTDVVAASHAAQVVASGDIGFNNWFTNQATIRANLSLGQPLFGGLTEFGVIVNKMDDKYIFGIDFASVINAIDLI